MHACASSVTKVMKPVEQQMALCIHARLLWCFCPGHSQEEKTLLIFCLAFCPFFWNQLINNVFALGVTSIKKVATLVT